jgi:hypothetical protein
LQELHKLQRRTPQTTEKNSTNYREELHILQRRTPHTPEENSTNSRGEENSTNSRGEYMARGSPCCYNRGAFCGGLLFERTSDAKTCDFSTQIGIGANKTIPC